MHPQKYFTFNCIINFVVCEMISKLRYLRIDVHVTIQSKLCPDIVIEYFSTTAY